MNYPDRWVVVKVTYQAEEPLEKVFCGWYGGYMGTDDWRLSSNVLTVVDHGHYYEFRNLSGSTYLCRKSDYGMSVWMANTFEYYRKEVEKIGGKMEVVESYNPHSGEGNGNQERKDSEGKARDHKGKSHSPKASKHTISL